METGKPEYTGNEMQAYTLGGTIGAEQIVIVGTGLPLVGAVLARRLLQPSCHLIVESGLMDFCPVEIPRSVSDLRSMAHCMATCPPYRYLGLQANELRHGRERLIGFISGAAVDPYGNVNSTCAGEYLRPKSRFPGSGGANGIASFCNTVIAMPHEKRRFTQTVDYITSPGWLDGPQGRRTHGLPVNRGPQAVVTDLGVLKFHPETKRMYLDGYYPGTSIEEVRDNTGFDIDVSSARMLPPPDMAAIRLLREIDPERIYLL